MFHNGKSGVVRRQEKKTWKTQEEKNVPFSVAKLAQLIQDKADLERDLKHEYNTSSLMKENQVLQNMKENPKAFYSFARSRQKSRARIGPFLDPSTKTPNPHPDFTARVLSDQYTSEFVQPRLEWVVKILRNSSVHYMVGQSSLI